MISNLNKKDPTFQIIWNEILKASTFQSQWERKVPIMWMERERVLMGKKSQGIKVQTFQEVKEITNIALKDNNTDEDVSMFLG